MAFPETWMTESGSFAYRVQPKCACSTVGQILYASDHGRYYDGDIHDATDGLLKWSHDADRPRISTALKTRSTFLFTTTRNPYHRVLSCFLDKICGIQRDGNRYRGLLAAQVMQRYGIDIGSPEDGFAFDQIRSFRRFLLFARDCLRFYRPMDPDIHWIPMVQPISSVIHHGGHFDAIVPIEDFNHRMAQVLAQRPTPIQVVPDTVPRFNETSAHGPQRAHPVSAYFDDLSHHLMWEMYHRDFMLLGYDPDAPDTAAPQRDIDLNELHARLKW